MAWCALAGIEARLKLADGYRLDVLGCADVAATIEALRSWYNDIAAGSASCFLTPEHYARAVALDGADKDVLVVLVRAGDELAGVYAVERNLAAMTLYGRLGAVAPTHRGSGIGALFLALTEHMGRAMGMGLAYGMVSLKSQYPQLIAEQQGWQLVGIMPGLDMEMVLPGVVKRVFEAIYVKVLAPAAQLQVPDTADLTPQTAALMSRLFPTIS